MHSDFLSPWGIFSLIMWQLWLKGQANFALTTSTEQILLIKELAMADPDVWSENVCKDTYDLEVRFNAVHLIITRN